MRYIDAYEIVQASLDGKVGGFPVTERLLSEYLDSAVQDVGKRVVRDVGIYSYNRWKDEPETRVDNTGTTVNPFALGYKHSRGFMLNTALTKGIKDGDIQIASGHYEMYGNSVFKIEIDGKNVPFLDEKRVLTTNTDTAVEDYQLGWWLWNDSHTYRSTVVNDDYPNSAFIAFENILPQYGITSTPTNSEVAPFERIRISGVTGGGDEQRDEINNSITYIAGINKAVEGTPSSAVSFITPHTSGSTSFDVAPRGAGVTITTDNWWVMFNKVPTVSDDIKVWFHKTPRVKGDHNSAIDLPDSLAQACVYHAMGHILNLAGNLQIASGYRGLARKMELEYTDTKSTGAPMPDILPNPFTDFNYK